MSITLRIVHEEMDTDLAARVRVYKPAGEGTLSFEETVESGESLDVELDELDRISIHTVKSK